MAEPGVSKRKYLVSAHDAGGAEVLSAWMARQSGVHFRCLVDGPAQEIFRRRFGFDFELARDLRDDWIRDVEKILTATSYGSDLELRVIEAARSIGKSTTSCLDHWVNYGARFRRGDTSVLPDRLWVFDQTAYLIAREVFPNVPLDLWPNFYVQELREIAARHAPFPKTEEGRVLYVAEPLSRANLALHGDPKRFGYDEFDALRLFLRWRQTEGATGRRAIVRLRPHPSESVKKYSEVLADFPSVQVEISPSSSLLEDCLWAEQVCGCSSMALFIADALGRTTSCAIPVPGAACLLPLANILYLRDLDFE